MGRQTERTHIGELAWQMKAGGQGTSAATIHTGACHSSMPQLPMRVPSLFLSATLLRLTVNSRPPDATTLAAEGISAN